MIKPYFAPQYFILVSLCLHGAILFCLNWNQQIHTQVSAFGAHHKVRFVFLAQKPLAVFKPPQKKITKKITKKSPRASRQLSNSISPASQPLALVRSVLPDGAQSLSLSNPFGSLALPEQFLGHGLFPRKYKAIFNVENEKTELEQLTPLISGSNYLDRLVLRAFRHQLQRLNPHALRSWAQRFAQGQTQGKFDVILEFGE